MSRDFVDMRANNQAFSGLHCPRAGPGRVEAIFAGPDPDPQGRATLSLALAL